MEKLEFKLWGGKRIKDVTAYLKDYLSKNDTDRIFIGCDSQNIGKKTKYAVAICLYSEMLQKGVHVLFLRESIPKIDENTKDGIERKLTGEYERVYEIAQFLEDELSDFATANWPEYNKEKGSKVCEIHLDYNPVEGRVERKKYRENKSFKLINKSVTWLRAIGYTVKHKPHDSWAASYAADRLCR